MATRYYALIFGIIYVLLGILGFIPGLVTMPGTVHETGTHGYLFGLFPVNWLHNLVHLVVGVLGLIAFGRFSAARSFARTMAIVFAILTILGLIPGLNTLFGFLPLYGNDIWLHALTAVVSAYFGWATAPVTAERPYTRGM